MKVPLVKASIAGLVSGSVSKFYGKKSNKSSVKSGLITAVSVIVTDTLFNLSDMLPNFFQFLGSYAQDVVSSLLDASVRMFGKKSEMITSNGGFVMDFLISLGATVVSAYIEAPIQQYLPAGLQNYA